MPRITYKHPPIIEALFELRFPTNDHWGMSSFVKFAQSAEKAGYPEVVDAADGFQVNFQTGEDAKHPELKKISRRIQTWNKAKNELWQASPEMFAANRRGPYLGWEKFRPHVFKGLEIYSKLAKPKKAVRAALHYINRIEFNNDEDPSEYVKFVPPAIAYADNFQTFTCHTEQGFSSGDSIVISSTRDPEVGKGFALLLNIIYIKPLPQLDLKTLRQSVEKGHQIVIDSFEKSITDKQRKRMVKI